MERKSERFQIPVKGLALGNHHFDFVVEDAFFEQYPLEEIHHGNIKLQLDVEKESRLMTFQFHFNGNLQLACDRCLENYRQPLQGDFRLIVKYGEKEEELSEELMTIPFETSRFDIAPYILEFIQLMLPIKHVHPDDAHGNSTCDPEMLKELEKFEKQAVDPRWAALKNVKIK
ncbi:DUF177 domain-containing protein [Candidatus Sulfidibacterium hydrothermale]|uniref:YceD family protein n=1 Tax=Candidatus Sulfidibacterium hydrothermale TaxID=2875962 RepID=UPI001F0AC92A|nr:DUF177 domain-containing protein [Candidatus Sulfidibacterium hydrothermale]UBM62643.1 DUF177 domain-containing protein [Candidatus Sulfidibacterium hydrothermale]